jgi:pyruvate dehydrogenase E2 component (dihydrolipoamide acetyltransferase)
VSEGSPTDPRGEPERERASRTQRTIAARMAAAKAGTPEFSVRDEVDMAAALAVRAGWDQADPDRPSLNDLIVKAGALTLRAHPRVNGSWAGDAAESFPHVNIGVAVAAPGLLLVPVIRDADQLALGALARESRRLAGAVRARTIAPAELSGATFSVSNLGMYGIVDFEAIIDAPQGAILAVAAVREVPVVAGGAVVPGVRMGLRLTCDHRLIYGADAAAFVRDLRGLLEDPGAWARP